MLLDASLLNTQHYKVRVKGKVEQSRERSSDLPYTLVKGRLGFTLDYGRPLYLYIYIYIYIYIYSSMDRLVSSIITLQRV